MEPITWGSGSGGQSYGQGSGSNHVSGGMWSVNYAGMPGAYGGPINVGPGAGGMNLGSAFLLAYRHSY
ncbi:hypothetical protein SLEP1_g40055 [Rubroshorea leprosula]|uniref:Uncharacterized protein n=1 Tax=Rubroshorea leprosula TaxID=152421 RepID=A0AAV5L320_9ROSI|nr:hypothetical protein SLEP1_g40055 [Rubroshorea leprosula]